MAHTLVENNVFAHIWWNHLLLLITLYDFYKSDKAHFVWVKESFPGNYVIP